MTQHTSGTPVIPLSDAPGAGINWGRPKPVVYLWAVAELIFVTNPWQISSRLRVAVLRLFGARVDKGVTYRARTRVKFPWKLEIGADSWIGEGVWIHNQDHVVVGSNVVLSQETLITTGSHAHRRDMALLTRPITIEDGVWVTSRCIVLGGVTISRSALITPGTVVKQNVPANTIFGTPEPGFLGSRFDPPPTEGSARNTDDQGSHS
jgi:putative colanic acid biosynthesis acetyltransferase WcaF